MSVSKRSGHHGDNEKANNDALEKRQHTRSELSRSWSETQLHDDDLPFARGPATLFTAKSSLPVSDGGPASKRGKYVSKACYCHQRKIKCDGDQPCRPCQSKGRDCVRTQAQPVGARSRKRLRPAQELEGPEAGRLSSHPTVEVLLSKLTELSEDIRRKSCNLHSHTPPQSRANRDQEGDPEINNSSPDSEVIDVPQEFDVGGNCQTFLGETSINQTLQHVEESLLQLSDEAGKLQHLEHLSPSTISIGRQSTRSIRQGADRIQHVLRRHTLRFSRKAWDVLFDLYCDEVYPLYPIFHLPTLKESYTNFWNIVESGCSPNQGSLAPGPPDSVVQILICLALGRCTTSARTDSVEGSHSAGWSLYCAAMDLLGDVFDPRGESHPDICRLQTLNIMVIYLIRLDSLEQAQKTLSLGISLAHNLALHREKVVESLPVFISEVARRNWWCMYVLDRRLALDTGRPFLLRDLNMDTKIPFDFPDDWLEGHKKGSLKLKDALASDGEIPPNANSPIPYLCSMIEYSKIVGKVWDALYRADAMDIASNPALFDFFEDLLTAWRQQLPPKLNCETSEPYDRPPQIQHGWEMKHRLLVHMRFIWLRLLIRKPLRHHTVSQDWLGNFSNEIICARLAQRVIDIFSRSFEEFKIYTFPFLQYLLGSTSIILGLIIKLPTFGSKYISSVLKGIRMIKIFCQKTWVSGKTARSVVKLIELASKIIGQDAPVLSKLNSPKEAQPVQAQPHLRAQQRPQQHQKQQQQLQQSVRDFRSSVPPGRYEEPNNFSAMFRSLRSDMSNGPRVRAVHGTDFDGYEIEPRNGQGAPLNAAGNTLFGISDAAVCDVPNDRQPLPSSQSGVLDPAFMVTPSALSTESEPTASMNSLEWPQQPGATHLVTTDFSFENYFANEVTQPSFMSGDDGISLDLMDNDIFSHLL